MEELFNGVVAKAEDRGEYDKLLKIITPNGIKTALMRGVKKHTAKLKACSMPFAFCQFSLLKKGGTNVVTAASPLGDFYSILHGDDTILAGSICLEVALHSFLDEDCAPLFVFLLKRLKDISLGHDPFAAAARFVQFVIHNSGFAYEYKPPNADINSVMDLLAHFYFLKDDDAADNLPRDLVLRTLKKLLDSFERNFDCKLNTKKSVE